MSGNKKKTRPIAGYEVLQSLFENGKSPLSDQFLRWKLWAKWAEIVGPTIAENAEPVGMNRGVLFVWVRSSSWMHQMVFMKDLIQNKINQNFQTNYVKSIRFTLDRREVPKSDDSDFRQHLAKLIPESQDLE